MSRAHSRAAVLGSAEDTRAGQRGLPLRRRPSVHLFHGQVLHPGLLWGPSYSVTHRGSGTMTVPADKGLSQTVLASLSRGPGPASPREQLGVAWSVLKQGDVSKK